MSGANVLSESATARRRATGRKIVQREIRDLDRVVGTIWNGCTREYMSVSGRIQFMRLVPESEGPRDFFLVRHNYQNAKAVGTLEYSIASNYTETFYEAGETTMMVNHRIRYISRDRWANYLLFEDHQLTLNDDGEITDIDLGFDFKCAGQSVG